MITTGSIIERNVVFIIMNLSLKLVNVLKLEGNDCSLDIFISVYMTLIMRILKIVKKCHDACVPVQVYHTIC
jgi:hypothetical protein